MAIQCLLIGLGQIGMGYDLNLDPARFVYSHTRAFSAHQAFELSGAVDQSEPQRLLFERHYKRPAFLNLSEALTKTKPEVIVIARNILFLYALSFVKTNLLRYQKFGQNSHKTYLFP